ncbi:MAG: PAC2 family protein [Gemmatimonadota bacterium]|nr:MAG: PAC2 family protein [Gemmatimonadota bacterium]
MANIKVYQDIEVEDPVMIAGWPGMGNVALGAVNYLRRKIETVPFAEIETSQFFAPDAVIVKNGLAKLPQVPQNLFYYSLAPAVIIFESNAQVSGADSIHFLKLILDFAQNFKVRRIYTGAAFPMPISHKEKPAVYGVANRKDLLNVIAKSHIEIMEGGQISGLNGLLLGYAEQRGIEAICLLATMPNYAISFPNPKASKAILSVLTRMLHVRIDMSELDAFSQEMDERMKAIEEKIREMFPTAGKGERAADLDKKEVPKYIMEKIEKLFQEAKGNREKAYDLKEELDRWDLFKFYEDRFLDLFKKDH